MKLWNGTSYVDPKDVKVWNGTTYVDPEVFEWDGVKFNKLWPNGFDRQRINMTGGQTQISNSWAEIPGWGTDDEFPATVAGNSLVARGSGAGLVVGLEWRFYDWGGRSAWVRIKRNGAVIYTAPTGRRGSALYFDGVYTDVADGDVFVAEAQYTGSFGTVYIQPADTILELREPIPSTTQKMVKTGTYDSGSNFDFKLVNGWSPDVVNPAVVASDRLVSQADGKVKIHASLDSQTDDSALSGVVYLMRGESILATGNLTDYQNRSILEITTPSIDVVKGEAFWLQTKTGSAINALIYANSYLEIIPV